jgi:uncharacterized membrane protein YheB (UPF0754 family)
MPVGGAAIGWVTNHLAIRMLFRPRQPVRVLGLTIQGLLPHRQAELADRVAEAIEQEFLSLEDIRSTLRDPEYRDALASRVEGWLRDYFREKVANGPRVLRVIGGGLADRLAAGAAQEVIRHLPALIEAALGEFEERFDMREVIRHNVEVFELDRLEALVLKLASRELRFIELLGGIIGGGVGLLLVLIEQGLGF